MYALLSFLFGLALAVIVFAGCAWKGHAEMLDMLTFTTTSTTTTTTLGCIEFDPWWIPGNPVPKDSPCRRWSL